MNRYYYDFHIHSCLSPCAENDMTPNNIAGMATLAGLNIVALTDHNSTKNCPAFFEAAKANGIIPIAGMELTTCEDIHVVCLFEHLEQAMEFDKKVNEQRILIENRTDIFGDQFITDGDDNIIGTEKYLLSNATMLSIDDAYELAVSCGGICYPAHIDRESNGIVATLGTFPDSPAYSHAELHDFGKKEEYVARFPILNKCMMLCGSDAHYLWDIRDKSVYFELDDEPYSSSLVRKKLFEALRSNK